MRLTTRTLLPRICLPLIALLSTACGDDLGAGGTFASCTDNSATSTSAGALGLNLSGSTTVGGSDIGQSFQIESAVTVTGVVLSLKGVVPTGNSLSGALTVTLEGDSGNAPNGTVAATGTYSIASISSTDYSEVAVTFGSTVTLAAETTYWLRLAASYSASSDTYVSWAGTDKNTFSSGKAGYKKYDSGLGQFVWKTVPGTDLVFRLACQ